MDLYKYFQDATFSHIFLSQMFHNIYLDSREYEHTTLPLAMCFTNQSLLACWHHL